MNWVEEIHKIQGNLHVFAGGKREIEIQEWEIDQIKVVETAKGLFRPIYL
jgi:hypothetical protein